MNDGHTAADRLQSFPNIWFRPPYKPQVTKRGRQGRPSLWLVEEIKEEIAGAPDTILQIRRQMLGCH